MLFLDESVESFSMRLSTTLACPNSLGHCRLKHFAQCALARRGTAKSGGRRSVVRLHSTVQEARYTLRARRERKLR